MRTDRINFLDLHFDRLTFEQVKRRLQAAKGAIPYCYVVTPNVDHVICIHREPSLRAIYEEANLCVCDSRILRLLARLRGIRLPLVLGSDLAATVLAEVVEPGDRIAVVGGNASTLDRLRVKFPQLDFTHHAPPMGLRSNPEARQKAAEFIAAAKARFIFLAVGSPQQEMIASEAKSIHGAQGVALCVGAGLEFVTGEQRRAPRAVQRLGLEWAHRLISNPGRMWRRYLVDGVKIFPLYLRWRPAGAWPLWTASIIALAGLAAAAFYTAGPDHSFSFTHDTQSRGSQDGSATIALPPPNLLRPLTPEQATEQNAERPFVQRPDSPASKFVLSGGSDDRQRALTCLTQAIYYEAASEGNDGERAVAQVVINRMRHPGYPASICGVVYQGSDRPAGCQFTFTCDGSLLRPPVPALWIRARKVAEDALKGKVFAPIGHATHYHADYVLPYWADSLDKTVQIGRHIFYRLRGSLGERNSFLQRYAGTEPPLPQPKPAVVLPPSNETQQLANALINDNGPKAGLAEVEKAGPGTLPLLADSSQATLIADGPAPSQVTKRPRSTTACSTGEHRQLTPLGASDLRADSETPTC